MKPSSSRRGSNDDNPPPEWFKNVELLDAKIVELLKQVNEIINEYDKPLDYIEWNANWFYWISIIQSSLMDLVWERREQVWKENIDPVDGSYHADSKIKLKDCIPR